MKTLKQWFMAGGAALMQLGATGWCADGAMSLEGRWRFQLDRADAGIGERWFAQKLAEKVTLPGSLTAQGIGDEVTVDTKWIGGIVDKSWFTAPEYEKYRRPGNVKIPFWLQPEKYYAGAAWYQRDFEAPKAWGASQSSFRWNGRIGRRASGWTSDISAPMTPSPRRTATSLARSRPAGTL